MELDDFKQLYQRKQNADPSSKENIETLLRKKSLSPMHTMLRNMRIELILGYLLCVILAIYALKEKDDTTTQVLAIAALVLTTAQALLFRPTILRLKKSIDATESDTLTWLRNSVHFLDRFVHLYRRTLHIAMPFAFVIGGIIGFNTSDSENQSAVVESFDGISNLGLVIIAVVLIGLTFWFVNFIIRVFYSKPLNALKASLAELEKSE